MNTGLSEKRSVIFLAVITLSLFPAYCYSQTGTENWWDEIIKEHKITGSDFREIGPNIIFSDSIAEREDWIYFNSPVYLSKGDSSYHIYNVDSVTFSKTDSVITLYNGISVGFGRFDKVYRPISIIEILKAIYKMQENTMISITESCSFSWIDKEYFPKKKYPISVSKKK